MRTRRGTPLFALSSAPFGADEEAGERASPKLAKRRAGLRHPYEPRYRGDIFLTKVGKVVPDPQPDVRGLKSLVELDRSRQLTMLVAAQRPVHGVMSRDNMARLTLESDPDGPT